MTSTCPACGGPVGPGDWRCTNTLENGEECGKLLTGDGEDGADDRRVGRAPR